MVSMRAESCPDFARNSQKSPQFMCLAPSTHWMAEIGRLISVALEVWMPATVNWNERIHNLGGGGWAGGNHTSTTLIGNAQGGVVAGTGYVTGTTDTGHLIGNGSFEER